MTKNADTTLGYIVPAGWVFRAEVDEDKLDTAQLRRTTDYDRAYSFGFDGPAVIIEVTAWPDNDRDFTLASFTLRNGTLSVRDGDDVQIPDADLATVLAVAAHLDETF